MHGIYHSTRARLLVVLRIVTVAIIGLGALAGVDATAGLSGSYSIGSSGDYSSISSAISALNSNGVSGPVTFEIANGSYSASSYFRLTSVSGMNATNTVTFRPASGASVTITGSIYGHGIFDIDGGSYYVIDGNSSSGATETRNMTLVNTYSSSYCCAVRIKRNANHNTVRNCNLQANSYYYLSSSSGGAVVMIGGSGSSYGNCDYNVIEQNQIGDPNNTYRSGYDVAVYGSYGYQSDYNEILNNDIINWGKGPYYYYNGYGVYINYARHTLVQGNDIHQTHAATIGYLYGLYVYDYDGYSTGTIVNANRIYDLKSSQSSKYPYFIYYSGNYTPSSDVFTFTNNMMLYDESSGYYLYGYYAYLYGSSGTVADENNSTYIDGSWRGYVYAKRVYYPNGNYLFHNNIMRIKGSGYLYGIYLYAYYGWSGVDWDHNLYDITASSSSNRRFAYWRSSGSSYGYSYSFSQWRSQTPWDDNGYSGSAGFIDPDNNNLHISTCAPSHVEGRGVPSTYVTTDFDGDRRDPQFPDIGADEGNFNGDGIRVLTPNGGEELTVGYPSNVQISLNRTLPLDFFLSTDNGANWMPAGNVAKDDTHAGVNTFSVIVPNIETHKALLRVVSAVNSCESDVSDATFSLVRPVVFLMAPNGGERWVASDTNTIVWQTQYVPGGLTVRLDYSTDNGSTWSTIADGLSNQNRPSTNTYDWIVPNTPSTTARVRAVVTGTSFGDTSDAVFTIIEEPSVKVLVPNGGERLIPGHKLTVSFSTVTTDNVNIDYSLDGGATWTEMAHRLPAYVGSYEWTVPQGPTGQGLVRVTNVERPRFSDVFDDYFLILSPELTVLSPNGGVYDLNEPVRVNWSGEDLTTLKLEYSSNNGLTWSTVATGLDATSGTYTFTPPAIPTDAGRVRLTDETVMTNTDMNDLPFHIAQEPSLLLFQPSGGETYVMGSEATVSWESYRIDAVNVEYSLNGGQTWTMIESNVPAIQGSLHWTVPHVATTKGEVRVTEVGRVNPLRATSGWFTIVEPKHPSLRMLTPNGGESYTEGGVVQLRWNAQDIDGGVTLSYSDDAGATWTKIASNVPATDVGTTGKYEWTAPHAPGDKYLVKVSSVGGVSDASDNTFTVVRELHPALTVIYPNGGETMMGGTDEVIRWSATDIPGNVTVSYSTDDGTTWSDLGVAAASASQLNWTIPTDVTTDAALVRVAGEDDPIADTSDNSFMIHQPIVPQIVVTNPNRGTERWMYGDTVPVEWTADNVDLVKIELSIDGGTHWHTLADAIDATKGTWDYEVEDLSDTTLDGVLVVRISDVNNPTVFDESDAPFTFVPGINAVPVVETGARALELEGAYPNPMIDRTQLRWRQAHAGSVVLRLYAEDGRMARELKLGSRSSGDQSVTVDGTDLAAGSYTVVLTVGAEHVSGRLIIVR